MQRDLHADAGEAAAGVLAEVTHLVGGQVLGVGVEAAHHARHRPAHERPLVHRVDVVRAHAVVHLDPQVERPIDTVALAGTCVVDEVTHQETGDERDEGDDGERLHRLNQPTGSTGFPFFRSSR